MKFVHLRGWRPTVSYPNVVSFILTESSLLTEHLVGVRRDSVGSPATRERGDDVSTSVPGRFPDSIIILFSDRTSEHKFMIN